MSLTDLDNMFDNKRISLKSKAQKTNLHAHQRITSMLTIMKEVHVIIFFLWKYQIQISPCEFNLCTAT